MRDERGDEIVGFVHEVVLDRAEARERLALRLLDVLTPGAHVLQMGGALVGEGAHGRTGLLDLAARPRRVGDRLPQRGHELLRLGRAGRRLGRPRLGLRHAHLGARGPFGLLRLLGGPLLRRRFGRPVGRGPHRDRLGVPGVHLSSQPSTVRLRRCCTFGATSVPLCCGLMQELSQWAEYPNSNINRGMRRVDRC
ncbi:MAG: hypothetical protein U0W40_19395 [Acidimicrobiia bacterium]